MALNYQLSCLFPKRGQLGLEIIESKIDSFCQIVSLYGGNWPQFSLFPHCHFGFFLSKKNSQYELKLSSKYSSSTLNIYQF